MSNCVVADLSVRLGLSSVASLPSSASKRPTRGTDTVPPPHAGARRVLLVESDPELRTSISRFIEADGYEVSYCGANEDVLIQVLTSRPDLVLVRARPRDPRALAICRQLRDFETARLRPVVLYGVGNQSDDAAARALEAGADDFVRNVGNGRELRARLSAQMRYLRDREVLHWASLQRSWLRDLAHADPLTGVANRRGATRALSQALAAGQPVAVVLVDLDHFKHFNDTYGHEVGDLVLRRVAAALTTATPRQGLACRWGGEEFAIVLPGDVHEKPEDVGERFRSAISQVAIVEIEGAPGVTASVGVAAWAGKGDKPSIASLIAAADAALYESKEGGRNRVSATSLPVAV